MKRYIYTFRRWKDGESFDQEVIATGETLAWEQVDTNIWDRVELIGTRPYFEQRESYRTERGE